MRWRSSTPIVVIGSLFVAAAGFLPWGASGRRERHSYELLAVLDRLDVLEDPFAQLARLWYLAPLLAAGTWLAFAAGRPRLALGLAGALATAGTVLALAVRASPLVPRSGPCATIGASVVVGAGLVVARIERVRTNATDE